MNQLKQLPSFKIDKAYISNTHKDEDKRVEFLSLIRKCSKTQEGRTRVQNWANHLQNANYGKRTGKQVSINCDFNNLFPSSPSSSSSSPENVNHLVNGESDQPDIGKSLIVDGTADGSYIDDTSAVGSNSISTSQSKDDTKATSIKRRLTFSEMKHSRAKKVEEGKVEKSAKRSLHKSFNAEDGETSTLTGDFNGHQTVASLQADQNSPVKSNANDQDEMNEEELRIWLNTTKVPKENIDSSLKKRNADAAIDQNCLPSLSVILVDIVASGLINKWCTSSNNDSIRKTPKRALQPTNDQTCLFEVDASKISNIVTECTSHTEKNATALSRKKLSSEKENDFVRKSTSIAQSRPNVSVTNNSEQSITGRSGSSGLLSDQDSDDEEYPFCIQAETNFSRSATSRSSVDAKLPKSKNIIDATERTVKGARTERNKVEKQDHRKSKSVAKKNILHTSKYIPPMSTPRHKEKLSSGKERISQRNPTPDSQSEEDTSLTIADDSAPTADVPKLCAAKAHDSVGSEESTLLKEKDSYGEQYPVYVNDPSDVESPPIREANQGSTVDSKAPDKAKKTVKESRSKRNKVEKQDHRKAKSVTKKKKQQSALKIQDDSVNNTTEVQPATKSKVTKKSNQDSKSHVQNRRDYFRINCEAKATPKLIVPQPSPDAVKKGLRRSKRARVRPLQTWYGETLVYGEDQKLLGLQTMKTFQSIDAEGEFQSNESPREFDFDKNEQMTTVEHEDEPPVVDLKPTEADSSKVKSTNKSKKNKRKLVSDRSIRSTTTSKNVDSPAPDSKSDEDLSKSTVHGKHVEQDDVNRGLRRSKRAKVGLLQTFDDDDLQVSSSFRSADEEKEAEQCEVPTTTEPYLRARVSAVQDENPPTVDRRRTEADSTKGKTKKSKKNKLKSVKEVTNRNNTTAKNMSSSVQDNNNSNCVANQELSTTTIQIIENGSHVDIEACRLISVEENEVAFGRDGKRWNPEDPVRFTKSISTSQHAMGTITIGPGQDKGLSKMKLDLLCFFVVRGTIELTLEDVVTTLSPLSYFYVPPTNSYNIRNLSHKETAFLSFTQIKDGSKKLL